MAINESVVLDSIELNPLPSVASPYSLDEISFPTPRKRYEWIQGSDADGASLVRDPLVDQRTITGTLRVTDTTRDAIDQDIAAIVAKLEEAETQPDGLPLVWTPADATKQLTFYVLSGEIGDIPITHESGYFAGSVAVPFTLTCKPFGYGSEVSGPSQTAATPLVTVAVPNVPGDVPAEARIVVTDNASQARRDVIWGLEWHDYNAASPASLLLANTDFVTTGFAGASSALAGSYGTGNPVAATLYGQPTAVLGTGNQPHIGTFRVRARIQATATTVRARLAWQDGDGPFSANDWISTPAVNSWCEVDLGLITIQPAKAGSQRWTGRVEAYTTDGVVQTVYINLLELIPAGEGYGRARATYSYRPGAVVARDDFGGFTTGNLAGRTAPVGGVWASAGAATDFYGINVAGGEVARNTTADGGAGRFATLGATMSDQEVQVAVQMSTNTAYSGVVARYVDTNNHVRAFIQTTNWVTLGMKTITAFGINVVVAGTVTAYAFPFAPYLMAINRWYVIRLVAYASGGVYATLFDTSSVASGSSLIITPTTVLATIAVTGITAVATGGALATGKGGLFDQGTTAVSGNERHFRDVSIATPAAEPVSIYSAQAIEFRSDQVLRKDSSGAYYGRPPAYRGGRALIPPAGDKGRTSRIVVAARRANTDAAADGGVTDSTTVQAYYTPRYLVVPH